MSSKSPNHSIIIPQLYKNQTYRTEPGNLVVVSGAMHDWLHPNSKQYIQGVCIIGMQDLTIMGMHAAGTT